ncbi:hypothetical protein ACL9RI_05590 [Janthinobacterium sp. Mn2066]|uniref:hypothetical protein n=1 Tax=Janthinobacterium sp. Mn2066 TaxID=3395264 RepID=UPI003BE06E16
MPRISPKRRAAFDILDCLFFNQTWLLRLSEEDEALNDDSPRTEELITLIKLTQLVDQEVAATGTVGVAAQALKHIVFCILEIGFSDNLVQKGQSGHADRLGLVDERGVPISTHSARFDPAQAANIHQYEQQFCMAQIVALGSLAHGVCSDTALTIAATVNAAFPDAPAVVRSSLAERAFIMEFMNAPLQFLSWMYRIGVLTSNKFAAGRVTREISDDFKARVGLLCEFKLMRDLMGGPSGGRKARGKNIRTLQEQLGDKLSDTAWNQLHEENDFYMRLERKKGHQHGTQTFKLDHLNDEEYLHGFLERYAENHWHSRFWTGPQQSWTGVIGAGIIWAHHSQVNPQRKITRNGNNYSKSGEAVKQDDTVAQHVCSVLNAHGLDSRPASLYETYLNCYMKRPAGLYQRATVYHAMQQHFDVVPPAQYHDIAYLAVITGASP